METIKFSKHAPGSIRNWLTSNWPKFSTSKTLYDLSQSSDRAIRSGRLTRLATLHQFVAWGVARLAASSGFTREHWNALAQVTHNYNDVEFRGFFGSALVPAVGGGVAWRANRAETDKLLLRAAVIVDELIGMVINARGMDVKLSELATWDSRFKPLADHLDQLLFKAHCRRAVDAKQRQTDPSLTSMADIPLDPAEPSLFDFLLLLERRLANIGNTPGGEDVQALADQHVVGYGGSPKFNVGGDFGAYPKRKKALRTATIHAIANRVLSPSAEAPSFSVSAFIQAICLAWFDDAPDLKEIDTLLRPRRAKRMAKADVNTGKVAPK
jgi:hypothetical protein